MAPIDIPAEINPHTMAANGRNPAIDPADRLAWTRLSAAVKAIERGDMDIAAAHLADSFAANPHILDEIAGR